MAKRRKWTAGEVPLSAMIDIIFQLLLFFILTAARQQDVLDYNIKLAESKHVKPPDSDDPRTFTINIRQEKGEAVPTYSISGNSYKLGEIQVMLSSHRRKYGEDVPVVVRASAELSYKYVEEFNKIVMKAGLYRVQHSSLSKFQEKQR